MYLFIKNYISSNWGVLEIAKGVLEIIKIKVILIWLWIFSTMHHYSILTQTFAVSLQRCKTASLQQEHTQQQAPSKNNKRNQNKTRWTNTHNVNYVGFTGTKFCGLWIEIVNNFWRFMDSYFPEFNFMNYEIRSNF